MSFFWCQIHNMSGNPIKVVITSWYGQGTYYLQPNQQQWVQWFPGQKVLTSWDQFTQQLVASYPFQVTGPTMHAVGGGNAQIPYQSGGPVSGTPPQGAQAGNQPANQI